jgi:DNA (cytosine-5)-methyltransferase 1
VFVVASARADFDPAAVLFEFEGFRRDIAPSREARQSVAPTVGTGAPFSRTGNERVEAEAIIITMAHGQAGAEIAIDRTPTLTCNHEAPIAFHPTQDPISIHPHCIGRAPEAGPQGKEYLLDGSAYCMDSRGQPQAVMAPCIGLDQELNAREELAGTLQRKGDGGFEGSVMNPSMQVRRLTPVECERLQGFPDNYTNIKDKCPDGPRYKALGNSWAVPVVRWIGERIARSLG